MKTSKIYQRHRYPAAIISHCVWFYYRFTLSYRNIELIMMKKGIAVTYESICYWCIKFGKIYAKRIKKTKRYGDYIYTDEVFCKIKGKHVYLWQAIDQDGQAIDVLVQEKRDSKASARFIKKLRNLLKNLFLRWLRISLKAISNQLKQYFPMHPISLSNMLIIEQKIHINQQGLEKRKCVNLNH